MAIPANLSTDGHTPFLLHVDSAPHMKSWTTPEGAYAEQGMELGVGGSVYMTFNKVQSYLQGMCTVASLI